MLDQLERMETRVMKRKRELLSGQSGELLDGQAAGTDQAAQGAFGHFPMIGYRKGGHVAFLDQNHVAAALPHHFLPILAECANHFVPSELRQRRHQIVISICCVSIVSGKPRSARTSRQAAMASRMLASASSRVWP